MPFIPHTEADIRAMLDVIGVADISALFAEVPENLRAKGLTSVPEGITEMALSRLLNERAAMNKPGLCFIGAGAYEHHIPAAVWDVATRGEFMTAYTPYQAEASQGTLQLIYEYQTMIAHLTGMDVSNASLYDGATALAEAILMAVRANKRSKANRILLPMTLHPAYRETIQTVVRAQQIELIELPYSLSTGSILLETLDHYAAEDITAIVIPYPNFFGMLEEVDALTNWAHARNALVIAQVNPTALAILKEPGKWGSHGADIVCGEGQPLGVPLAFGGPYFGFLSCKQDYIRQMPGRLVGRTVDVDGKPGFALTLQAREQHIRRSKATSNICTNQGLLVTAATIYMSLVGSEGLRRVASHCHANTRELVQQLTELDGVDAVFHGVFFHEAVLRWSQPVAGVLEKLADAGIMGGYDISGLYPELGNAVLVCVTETKTAADIAHYKQVLAAVLK